MADKADKKPDGANAGGSAAGDKKDGGSGAKKSAAAGGLLSKTPVLLGGVMLLEAVVLFAGFKFLGSGAQRAAGADIASIASGEDGHAGAHGDGKSGADGAGSNAARAQTVEIQILAFRAPNKLAGRTFLYDVDIYAVTKP